MIKNLYVIRKGSLFVILIFMFYFLPLQSTSATVLEYSISGNASFWSTGDIWTALEITGTAFIDDEKTPYYSAGDPACPAGGSHSCDTQFNFTYFDMHVGSEYNFTGTSGHIKYTNSDTFGALSGTGDWSMMSHSTDSGYLAPILNYEEWLTFELPSVIGWEAGHLCCNGLVEVANPFLQDQRHFFAVTLERVAPVPAPAAAWLFGSGLLGLIGAARRKTA